MPRQAPDHCGAAHPESPAVDGVRPRKVLPLTLCCHMQISPAASGAARCVACTLCVGNTWGICLAWGNYLWAACCAGRTQRRQQIMWRSSGGSIASATPSSRPATLRCRASQQALVSPFTAASCQQCYVVLLPSTPAVPAQLNFRQHRVCTCDALLMLPPHRALQGAFRALTCMSLLCSTLSMQRLSGLTAFGQPAGCRYSGALPCADSQAPAGRVLGQLNRPSAKVLHASARTSSFVAFTEVT